MTTNSLERSRIALYIESRIEEMKGVKLQREIAREAGFTNPNFLSMIKSGESKLSIDRVPALAKALEVDPKYLFRLAIEQFYSDEVVKSILDMMGEAVTDNEKRILETIREETGNSNPAMTDKMAEDLQDLFRN